MPLRSARLRPALAALALAAALGARAALADPVYGGGEPLGRHEVEAFYPAQAERARETGEVVVELVIAPDGSVSEAFVDVSSGHFDLDDAAIAAVHSWRYTPPTRDGKPISTRRLVKVEFTLRGSPLFDLYSGESSDCANSSLSNEKRIAA